MDLTFADFKELHGTLRNSVNYQIYQGLSIHFDSNSDKRDFFFKQRRKISGFYGIFQIFPGSTLPKPRYPSHANSRDKESLNSSTQAKPSHA